MTGLPRHMRCIEIAAPGGPEQLVPATRPIPEPGDDDVLIKIAFAGVNRADVAQRLGRYPAPRGASDIPGLEAAGTIVACGNNVRRFKPGDEVCALLTGGGYAEFVVTPAATCLSVPQGLSLEQAAGLPETFMTVWHNVFQRGGLKAGEVFLVHGGSSGIGTIAIQLGKIFGAYVATTAGSKQKCEACKGLGADLALDYRVVDFVEELRAHAPGGGADIILDMVGGSYVARNFKCLKAEGRLVQIAFAQGANIEIDLLPVMTKRITLTGSTLRARDTAFKAALGAELEAEVWPLLSQGRVKPVLDQTFPLARANDAHRRMECSIHIGKILLRAGPNP